eukprot:COSAG05_NODE_1542_length_4595_cov_6.104315_4_plen_208_part_00
MCSLAVGDDNVPGSRRVEATHDLLALGCDATEITDIIDAHDACVSGNCNHKFWIGHHFRGNRAGRHGRLVINDVQIEVQTMGGRERREAQRPLPNRPWSGAQGIDASPHVRGKDALVAKCLGCVECVSRQFIENDAEFVDLRRTDMVTDTRVTPSLHTVYTQFTWSLHTELYSLSRDPHPSTPPHRARRCLRARIHCPGSPCQHGVA